MNGNLIETNFRNYGQVSQWGDEPRGVWPRGVGNRHVDGIHPVVCGRVPGERTDFREVYNAQFDTTLTPCISHVSLRGIKLVDDTTWGWLPLPGFLNPNRTNPITGEREPHPAVSTDAETWPAFWPDRLDNPDDPGWAGNWNGFFGKGVFNADEESYAVADDHSDFEYRIDPGTGLPNSPYGVFYPDPSDSTMGGMGLQMTIRQFQWGNVLAEDAMFLVYRITNVGGTDLSQLFFNQGFDPGMGQEEDDERSLFNPQQDVAYIWDSDGIGTLPTGGSYRLGYTGLAFLESPVRRDDGLDNDEDGFADESRFSGPGMLIQGQAEIRAYVEANYDLDRFEAFYGPLESRPAYRAGVWWTGDENLDWARFADANENGVLDPGERINDDLGLDGLGPNDLDYPGPDTGEADGRPDPGEPNFDQTDLDEGDQIGLTGFLNKELELFFVGQEGWQTDWRVWDRVMEAQFPLGTEPAVSQTAGVQPFLFYSSGPVALAPGQTDFFSTGWIFGDNVQDFLRNRRTVQEIYNADYRFAQPPQMPKLTAQPGDGVVVLSWDTVSVGSFDRFTQEFDFEGYKLYKGTDPLLSDARLITDADGTPTFYKPIAQWDLANGIRGKQTVQRGNAIYDLGTDNGLQFSYIDREVTNGITYYYALVAYDRGFTNRDDPDAEVIDPQENTFRIGTDLAGNVRNTTPNTAVVTPRARAAGYVSPSVNEDLSRVTSGVGSGSIEVLIVDEEAVDPEAVYRLGFVSTPDPANEAFYLTSGYTVDNLTTGERIVGTQPFDGRQSVLIDETFLVNFFNDTELVYDPERLGWVVDAGTPNEAYSLDPRDLPSLQTNWVLRLQPDTTISYVPSYNDYEVRWVDPGDSTYRPPRFGLGRYLRDPIPIFARDLNADVAVDLLIDDLDNDGAFSVGDELVIVDRNPITQRLAFRHRIRFDAPEGETSAPPGPGAVLRISNLKPWATGDYFQFTLRPGTIDPEVALAELDEIAVVPNPYVGAAEWEPRQPQITGRGPRRVQFVNLPQSCTVKIFTIRGELVRTLRHDGIGSDGAMFWDLKTEDNQDVAFGVYLYHVDAPGIGEHVGKFALIK